MSEENEFRKHLEKKNDFLFVEHWQEGKGTFNWAAEWEWLDLKLSNVVITEVTSVSDREVFENDDKEHLNLVRTEVDDDERLFFTSDVDRSNFKTDEEYEAAVKKEKEEQREEERAAREEVGKIFNHCFTKPVQASDRIIRADFEIDNRSIGFIEDNSEDYDGIHDTHTSGKIMFRVAESDCVGSLWCAEEEANTLMIELSVTQDRLDAISKKLRNGQPQSECTARLSALVFQSEVERSLAEHYHHQTYYFQKEKLFGPVMLHDVRISERLNGYVALEDDNSDFDEPNLEEVLLGPKPQPNRKNLDKAPVINLRPLTIAVWAVFGALIFATFR